MANIINGTDTGSGGLITTGDSSDELQLQTAETARVTLTNTAVVVNEDGNDVDFRVESDTEANALFVDGQSGNIGFSKGSFTPLGSAARATRVFASGADDATSEVEGSGAWFRSYSTNVSNYGFGGWQHYDNTGTNSGGIIFGGTLNMKFYTRPSGGSTTERMNLTSDGYLRLLAGTGGIQFNGDTAAANALDDYEEGTWTPEIADATTGGNASPTTATSAIYTKVGRIVNVQCFFANVDTTGMTAGNDVVIRGFPFNAVSLASTTFIPGSIIVQQISFTGYLTPYINDNQTYGKIIESTSGAISDAIVVSEFSSGVTDFYLNITYQAA